MNKTYFKRRLNQAFTIACLIALIPAIAACFGYKVGKINYESSQSAAAILISDPQVFSRASLINDRRRESDYLQQLLANSVVDSAGKSGVIFSPQIVRDLKTVQALSANLGLSVGKASSDSSSVNDLTQQLEVTRLQAQLAVLEKQVEGIQNAPPPEVTIPAPDLKSSNGIVSTESGGNSSVTTPDVSGLHSAIKAIQSQLASLTSVGGPTAPGDKYAALADPRNDFIDRQAYRRDIRAALSEAQLDDVHDRGGNALYRLQFQATVLPPGGAASQWGAAKMQISPPSLHAEDIEAAYYRWLGYLSGQLNTAVQGQYSAQSTTPNQVHSYDLDRYLGEVGRLNYFNVIDLFRTAASESAFFCLSHRTAENVQLDEISNNNTDKSKAFLQRYERLGTYAVPPTLIEEDSCDSYPTLTGEYRLTKQLNAESAKSAMGWITQYTPKHDTFNSEKYILSSSRDKTVAVDGTLDSFDYVPRAFCEAIVKASDIGICANLKSFKGEVGAAGGNVPDSSRVGHLAGENDYAVRSYSVLPTELAQRLGVTTEASQSLQTALSVASQVSTTAKASLDAGYLSQSDARAQALARQPIVVGFAGSEPETAANKSAGTSGKGFFGWLFGPEFSIFDTHTLALQQDVHSYGVNADVSFPGWWSYIDLDISTAWIKDWKSAELMSLSSDNDVVLSPVRKRVSLPASDATYESLTNFIAAKQYGPQNSRIFISYVTPTLVPACSTSVTFQIGGTNIWRADSIYLGGVKAKAINVLPDMNGVAAEFDMNAVFGTLVNTDTTVQSIQLMVSSEQGSAAAFGIWVAGKRQTANGATSCQSPILLPENLESVAPTILSYSPLDLCLDATNVPLVLQGVNLADFDVYSQQFESTDLGNKHNWVGDGFRRAAFLKLRKGEKLTPGNVAIGLHSSYGSLGVNLPVKDCVAAAKVAAAPQSKAGVPAGVKAPAKAALQSATVQLAKDQKIILKATVPAGYAAIVVRVRQQAKDNNLIWVASTTTVASVGTPGTVTGTFDLSNMNWPVGSKLDVDITIQTNPGVEPTVIAADKELSVGKLSATPAAQSAAKALTEAKKSNVAPK